MDDEVPRKTCVYLKTFWNVQLLTNYLKIVFRKLEKRKRFFVVADVTIAYTRQ